MPALCFKCIGYIKGNRKYGMKRLNVCVEGIGGGGGGGGGGVMTCIMACTKNPKLFYS